MRATWQGQVIADSDAALEVGGYHYFPRSSVRMDLLRAATKTAADHRCPHGVQFYDVVDARHTSPRNAWSYEKPGSAMQKVDHWIGFWDEVEVA
ncbi:MAG: DUF427 domain-containing protein [Planctomycetota bacterium]